MRVATDTRLLEVDPGSTADVVVDVVNTGAVIDGVSARIIGLSDQYVTAQPALLPLFPDASGRLTLSVAVPSTLPAGRHPLTVEVVSHGARLPSQYLDVDLDVASRPVLALVAQPRTIRARRGARFVLELANQGNVALEVTIGAVDADRAVRTELVPAALRIEAGATAPVLLAVRGPRMFTGGEIDRTVTVAATARAIGPGPDTDADLHELQETRETTVRLRQRPLISRGLLTALILASIVALWAGVFLLGLTKVFSGDPMTKEAPASFFLPKHTGKAAGAAGGGGAAEVAPADSLPRSGQVPPGIGGAISGTVVATNAHQPVGRILVQAWRDGRNGPKLVSSAATQSDGTYTLGGLFPSAYYLEFTATGYKPVWYPDVPGANPIPSGAKQALVQAQQTTPAMDVVITGLPATISGTVSAGDTLQTVTTKVSARPLVGAHTDLVVAETTTDKKGNYHLTGLPAPGSYELTFITGGYQTSTLVDAVDGGAKRLEPTLTLGASTGQIGGTVTDGSVPIGGVIVSTTVNGKPVTVTTPTVGQVGAYVLGNLPTPGTYVVTYSSPGHGSTTKIIPLDAGQSVVRPDLVLTTGSGTITGKLVDENGNGLGGATLVVGGATTTGGQGAAAAPTTTTLTSGTIGAFAISGLPAPGSYELTFTLDGYAPASVPVSLSANGAPRSVTVTLSIHLGGITGRVREAKLLDNQTLQILADPFPGATVTATNGHQVWTAISSAAGGALDHGGYLIEGLQPGTYSVTVSAPGLQQQTGIVTIGAGDPKRLDLTLIKAG